MNKEELKIKYRKETGKQAPQIVETTYGYESDYVEWLEEQVMKDSTVTLKGSDIISVKKIQNYK